MEDLRQFLAALFRGLDCLERRLKDTRCPAVEYSRNAERTVAGDEVAIGTGKFKFAAVGAAWPGGICLNNKQMRKTLTGAEEQSSGVEGARSVSFASVSDLALNAPTELFEGWRGVVGGDGSPEKFFARFKLIVEDASPDSCFGLLCLLMRLSGLGKEAVPPEWVNYIEGWERGEVDVHESSYCAYGPLHNALVHGKFNLDILPMSDPEHSHDADDIGGAWIDGLRFMLEALTSRQPPLALSPSLSSPIFVRARALLRFEEEIYEESFEGATFVQLSLPITDTENRYRLVDAYIAPPLPPLGSLKVFTRNDRTRPFLKNGFTLMAIESIGEQDISVDPSAGVELKELWLKLEEEEDRRWGPDRPHDNPRGNIRGYPDGKRRDGSPAPNEPWYDGRDYTLIASPREVKDKDGQTVPGSKLDWSDVLEILWQTYQPFRRVKVLCGLTEARGDELSPNKLMSLEKCYRVILSDELEQKSLSEQKTQKAEPPRLFVARWPRPGSSVPAFTVTPTLCKYLAACIRRRPAASQEPVRLADLPDESTFDVLEWPGMLAIIVEKGAFLVYDEQRVKPPLYEIKTEFERAFAIRRRLERGRDDLEKLLDDIKAYYEGRRRDLVEQELAERLTTEAIALALELHKAGSATVSREARRFREAVLGRWGIEGWINALARDVEQIKNVLYGRAGLAAANHLEFLRRYAVPVGLAAIFYAICAATVSLWAWQPNAGTIERVALGMIVLGLLSYFNYVSLEYLSARRRLRLQAASDRPAGSASPPGVPSEAASSPPPGSALALSGLGDRQGLREAPRSAE
jgi:hypothetical protein